MGLFFPYLVVFMTDRVQAKQDLEFCSAELSKYQNFTITQLGLYLTVPDDLK